MNTKFLRYEGKRREDKATKSVRKVEQFILDLKN